MASALSALIVVAIPVILVGNALWILMNSWFIEALYALPGIPADGLGPSDQARTDLAITGMRSIQPQSDGVELLREARLPSGEAAFEEREVSHMEDVRGVVAGFLTAWVSALVFAVAAATLLRRLGKPGSLGRALLGGAGLTVAAMGLVGVVVLVNFDTFFDAFHGVFFEGDSWRFDSTSTVRQLYPDLFWQIAAGAMAALVALQAVALAVGVSRTGPRIRRVATPGRAQRA